VADTVSFAELQRRTQANLIAFLRTEIDLAWTMLNVMNTTNAEEPKARIMTAIQTAIDTVLHFEKRVTDRDVQSELHQAVSRLERTIRGSSSVG
jgi:hypothetical protein